MADQTNFAGLAIPQEYRICGACGRRFQSGVVRVQRGTPNGAMCQNGIRDGYKPLSIHAPRNRFLDWLRKA